MSAGTLELIAAIQTDRLRRAEQARLASTLASQRRSRRVRLPLRRLLAHRAGPGRAAGSAPVSSAVCPAPRL